MSTTSTNTNYTYYYRFHLWYSAKHYTQNANEGGDSIFYTLENGAEVIITNAERVIEGKEPDGSYYLWPDKVYLGIGTFSRIVGGSQKTMGGYNG